MLTQLTANPPARNSSSPKGSLRTLEPGFTTVRDLGGLSISRQSRCATSSIHGEILALACSSAANGLTAAHALTSRAHLSCGRHRRRQSPKFSAPSAQQQVAARTDVLKLYASTGTDRRRHPNFTNLLFAAEIKGKPPLTDRPPVRQKNPPSILTAPQPDVGAHSGPRRPVTHSHTDH